MYSTILNLKKKSTPNFAEVLECLSIMYVILCARCIDDKWRRLAACGSRKVNDQRGVLVGKSTHTIKFTRPFVMGVQNYSKPKVTQPKNVAQVP
jgi:hypothetical protein